MPSRAVHSRYRRRPADLPSLGRAVRVDLRLRRFYCRNAACPRRTFAERLPEQPSDPTPAAQADWPKLRRGSGRRSGTAHPRCRPPRSSLGCSSNRRGRWRGLMPPSWRGSSRHPAAAHVAGLARQLTALVRGCGVNPKVGPEAARVTLDTWLADARACGVRALETFAAGLEQDGAAIRAALTTPWSSGQAEGHTTRLKLIKRQMYGRASFEPASAGVFSLRHDPRKLRESHSQGGSPPAAIEKWEESPPN